MDGCKENGLLWKYEDGLVVNMLEPMYIYPCKG